MSVRVLNISSVNWARRRVSKLCLEYHLPVGGEGGLHLVGERLPMQVGKGVVYWDGHRPLWRLTAILIHVGKLCVQGLARCAFCCPDSALKSSQKTLVEFAAG